MMGRAMAENGEAGFALAVGQLLALARSSGVSFDMIGGRVVMRAVNLKAQQWAPIRALLHELGIARIEAFFRDTADDDREKLSAIAAVRHPRARAAG
jgi:hypothetical protein